MSETAAPPPADTSPRTPATRLPGLRIAGRQLAPLTLLAAAVAVLVVAALVLSLVEWSSQSSTASRLQRLQSLRTSATRAATAYAVEFGSYDYHDLHGPTAPWTLLEDHSTPRFRSDFQTTSKTLETAIVTYKSTAAATVPVTGVTSVSASTAVVMMQVKQVISNSTQKNGPQPAAFLVVMTLVRQHGQWLVDNVSVPF